jgi:2-polyprenyl-3-methyl-5-hydroxy-6-metoxy-1,4-benzoquinol methylase
MLTVRATTEEQMDAPGLDPAIYDAVLGDLAKVNTVTMARRPTLAFLGQIKRQPKPIKILDVGFGDGDMLRAVAKWGRRSGISLTLVGIDLNPKSVSAAQRATSLEDAIDYRAGDYSDLAGQGWDVIMSSLVAHHMSAAQLTSFLKFMDAEAALGWHINDLHRHGFAYLGYPLLARIMGWHRIVREDGRLSIARSYRPHEWPPILANAGVSGARVVRRFPFRLCVDKLR